MPETRKKEGRPPPGEMQEEFVQQQRQPAEI